MSVTRTCKRRMRRGYLAQAIALGIAQKPGTFSVIRVAHDDWCSIFRGGECDCYPDITQNSSQKSSRVS